MNDPKITEILGEGHPIWVEMERLSPGYVPTEVQANRMKKADDPAKVALYLESYMLDIKEDAARFLSPLGIKPGDITNAEALFAIVEFGPWSGTSGLDQTQARRLGPLALVAIGMRKAVADLCVHNTGFARIDAVYREVFGENRAVDALGLGFYSEVNLPPEELKSHLHEAKAAGAK